MKALDFVRTPQGNIAIISETNGGGKEASISFLGKQNPNGERNAWWDEKDLKVIDSLPRLLANMTTHSFGDGRRDVKRFFPLTSKR